MPTTLKTAEERRAAAAAKDARRRTRRDAAGLVLVRVTATAAAGAFITELARRSREGQPLELVLADMLGLTLAAPVTLPDTPPASQPATLIPAVPGESAFMRQMRERAAANSVKTQP